MLAFTLLCAGFWPLFAEQIVFPQAAVGPVDGSGTFEIDLRIGNLNREESLDVRIRLLEGSDLSGMSEIVFQDDFGNEFVVADGDHLTTLAPLQSVSYQISSNLSQVGVLVLETPGQSVSEDFSTSFFYKLIDNQGKITDLIAVPGVRESASAYQGLIASKGTFNVGVAVVAQRSLDASPAGFGTTTVDLIATMADGTEHAGQIILGGTEPQQKAFFPKNEIPGLAAGADFPVALLRVQSDERLFAAVFGLVSPSDALNVQIGSAPLSPLNLLPTGGFQLDVRDRRSIADLYNQVILASQSVAPKWTGRYGNCDPGTLSATYMDSVLRTVNFFRAMAGVSDDITLDDIFNRDAQAAALMMGAEGSLSHNPPNTWACFSEAGTRGALRSNLTLGRSVDAVTIVGGFMEDPGDSNAGVGHRRWLLQPGQERMGVGVAFDPTQTPFPGAGAIYVVGPRSTLTRVVAWPPEGFVPFQLLYPRWSYSSPGADFSTAVVTMMTSSGDPVSLEVVAFGEGDGTSTGRSPFIVWEPTILTTPADGSTFNVTIQFLENGQPRQISYDVTVIDPSL